jgi:hypothetical protein
MLAPGANATADGLLQLMRLTAALRSPLRLLRGYDIQAAMWPTMDVIEPAITYRMRRSGVPGC